MRRAKRQSVRGKTRGRARDRETVLKLSVELQQLTFDIQAQLGVAARERSRIYSLAMTRRSKASRASDKVLASSHQMSKILAAWHRSPEYLSIDGSPKVIPIHGKGITFETLVRRYLPKMPIAQAVDFLVAHTDVRRRPEARLALLGSPAFIFGRTPESALAIINQRFRRLSRSIIKNSKLPQHMKGTGLYERQVSGRMTKKESQEFAREIREQLQDVIDHVDTRLEERRPGKGTRRECGVTVFLWTDF